MTPMWLPCSPLFTLFCSPFFLNATVCQRQSTSIPVFKRSSHQFWRMMIRRTTGSVFARHGAGCSGTLAPLHCLSRGLTINGRVTNEDRRWWLVHLECCPDVNPGTFVSWLDGCGTHTTKKLIERNLWTIEQVASLDSDQVDELKHKEGCIKMDIVWEHARTILAPLKQRAVSGGVESELQNKILQLRKKRELERRREEIIAERVQTSEAREETLERLRASIAAKKAELLRRQQEKAKQQQQQEAGASAAGEGSGEADAETMVKDVLDRLGGEGDGKGGR